MISDGLTSEEARKKLEKYGFNKIDEKKENFLRKVFHWFLSPISLMLLGAASLSLFSGKKFDFYFILILILINFFVAFWQERKADNAIKKLQEHLSVKVNVKRDGKWKTVDSSNLVPGDLIRLNVGDIVSADVSILAASNLFINEAVLTGESLPQEKKDGDKVFSGAFVVTGQGEARVTATGKNTYFNKTLLAVEKSEKRSILETDIMLIAKFLALLSISAVTILTLFFLLRGEKILELTTIALSLIIAGIPISLPTVITLIISLGVLSLAKKGSIVRRISSLEDLANVDLLFTDKTGTLTKNEIQAGKIIPYGASEKDVLFFSFLAEAGNETNPINRAIIKRAKESGSIEQDYKIINFIPADSERKRSTTYAVVGGEKITVSSGAPQIIESLCDLSDDQKIVLRKDIQSAADEGHRAILVAVNKSGHKEEKMKLVGMILLSDTLYPGTRKIIRFLEDSGMEVRMVTGDHRGIAQKIGREVGLMEKQIYYEVLPGEKYQLVKDASLSRVVAVTGDGINDLPAIRAANVGIAVRNAVDALKSSADIVLLSSGISTIRNVVIESRKIFSRVYTYSVYRISESFRVIITISILGLIYHKYPLVPVQLLLLALLNDIPIISLAFNRVKDVSKPRKIKTRERFVLSSLFGMVGVINSLLLFFIMIKLNLSWDYIQSIFFLKLVVSGHLLIYVAHTKNLWYKFLPSKEVIAATFGTQTLATMFAFFGIFIPKISIGWIIFVWIWSIFWMQISELAKKVSSKILNKWKNSGESSFF